ncbi:MULTISPECIES: hypothetical protein [Paenibacillus]|uniref:hypothetical protein n=1 Tax=Paenibacillus TaxID=44249 RepID=UPI0004654535|nr:MULTISPECIES: hypothetical protein [Paenibacillus]KGP80192.1 hypothetical protein P364_0120505 [Paenibacillus sp. MAEPY2]KGP86363.1 hypothetical protein P363_0117295 [Paenibacillus sp. MAEPY1]OZQ67059.1 hypothetical protein CA599_17775 [Paenibacillus taichungensis]HBU81646.1 hypothetical protein [Paenibacillus sp.]
MNVDEFLGGVRVLYDLKGEASMYLLLGYYFSALKENIQRPRRLLMNNENPAIVLHMPLSS